MKFQIIAGEPAVDFVNTLDNRPDPGKTTELLNNYVDLVEWAAQAGIIGSGQRLLLLHAAAKNAKAARQSLMLAIDLRECLFRIFSNVVAARTPEAQDLHRFNSHLSKVLSHLRLKPSGKALRLGWEENRDLPLDSVLWPITRSASELLTSEDLQYLRECKDDTCRWMFVDRSKNHSRRWCDMKICGNRVKARRFYRRQHA